MKVLQDTKKPDYTGETIHVGIDVHKKQWTVTIMSEHLEHKTFVQPPCAETLSAYLRKHFPGGEYRSVYEAGFCGFSVHDRLESAGISNIVINPADIPTTDKERKRKRDKVDSRKLCRRLRAGELEGVYVPTVAEREEKEVMRLRNRLVKDITRYKNRIKSYLVRSGTVVPEELKTGYEKWSKKFLDWLGKVELNTGVGTLSLKALLAELRAIEEVKRGLEKDLIKELGTKYKEELPLLRSVPGIGTVAGLTILAEVGDTSRFRTLDSLCSFVGLVPDTHGSGEREPAGRITGRKNKYLQPVLIQSAWTAARKDPVLMLSYEKLCPRMSGSQAIVRICRKLLSRIRHVLHTREPYRYMVS